MQKVEFVLLEVNEQLRVVQADLEKQEVASLSWFCEQYTAAPEATKEEKLELLRSLSSVLADRPLVESVLSGVANVVPSQSVEVFTSAVWIFSKIEGLEQAVSKAGNLVHLVSVLTQLSTDSSQVESIKNGLRALSSLAWDKDVRDAMALEGVMSMITTLLTNQGTDREVVMAILAALTNVFYQCLYNKQTFVRSGGLTILLTHARAKINDSALMDLAIVTLRNLCCGGDPFHPAGDDHRTSLAATEGLISFLMEVSQTHAANATLQDHVLWTFLNLSLNSRLIKGTLNQSQSIPLIFSILENHKDNPTVVLRVVTLLNQISTRTTTRVAVAKQDGIPVILNTLYTQEGRAEVQLMCLRLIDILCTLSLCRKRIAQENRLKTLLTWLLKEESISRRDYIEVGLNICQKLAMSAAESKQALQDCSGYTFFVTVNSHFNNDQDIQYLTVTGMSSLAETAEYENESSEEEVLSSDVSEDSEEMEYDTY